ncbi:transcriptional regulator [Bifidobacterium lemurum]|uniref:Transcriptional regulator n=1 Tax=Bifidobacterium lemurum TaxID=1603886 RepID=A0A261FSR5_9BIFI|nr:LacI family DNA-binding transcriptional regulator [Bifidobacterium lemurum]OZG62189.1 transcriptional regulator [Bifidobacterium lemurum]QOL33564.1 LacI family DNA-binding transcriptional regulator [Bifidobacterium lemurum]
MAKATIADIAREAGVSVTTVSRFINGNFSKMRPETRQRIEQTVARLDYRPSASARRMRQQRTHVVGVIVGDISNVFSSLLFKGIYTQLQPAGYDVMLMNSNNSVDEERDEISRLLSQEVDGLIIQPNCKRFSAYSPIVSASIPLVMVDREPDDQPGDIAKVTVDNHGSCRTLAGLLAERGYENVVALSNIRSEISAQMPRLEGLRRGCDEHGMLMIPIEANGHDVAWLTQELRALTGRLAGRTALVSLMGPMLFDTLAALRELGLRFPEDVGVVSFDDWRWSQYVRQGIHLLEQDPQRMGQEAAANLLEQMNADADPYALAKQTTLSVAEIPAPSI